MKKDYNSFVQNVAKELEKILGDSHAVHCQEIKKNNRVTYQTVAISDHVHTVSTCYRMEDYYELYEKPEDIKTIAKDILKIYSQETTPDFPMGWIHDKDEALGSVMFRIVSRDSNTGLLRNVPHHDIPELNLSMLFYSTCICAGCGSEKTLTEQKSTAASTGEEKKKGAKKSKDASDNEAKKDSDDQLSDNGSGPYNITSAKEAKAYMNQCTWDFSWDKLMRYEEDYIGQNIAFTGMVSQILDDDTLVVYDDANGDGIYADGQYYVIDKRGFDTTRILENDEIAIYGQYVGPAKLTRAIGNTETSLPELHMYVCDFAEVELKADEETVENMDYSPYEDIIIDTGGGTYTLYDIDGDGIKELITSNGTNTVNFSNVVYAIDIYGQVSMIGEFFGLVSLYETEDEVGLYAVNESIGYESADLITKSDMQLNVINLTSGEDAVNYKNESPVLMADANDLSLLQIENSMNKG